MTPSPYPSFYLPRFGLSLHWQHGGGFCPGLLVWRISGQLLAVVRAGAC